MESFFPSAARQRLVPGVGRETAKLVIVGDYTDGIDERMLKPFSGPGGSVLEQCMHVAGIVRGEVYLTNTFKSKSTLPGNRAGYDFFDEHKKKFTEKGLEHVKMLHDELNGMKPNVIVAAGPAATAALADVPSLAKHRGYVTTATKLKAPVKVIPTFSPTSTLRGSYTNRHIIICDLRKARLQSNVIGLVRPERTLIYDYTSVEEVLQWLDYFYNQPELCFDIEVVNYEVACISFSASPKVGCVIPLGATVFRTNGWSEQEELQIMRALQRVLGNPNSIKVVQNGAIFDNLFLLSNSGIEVRGEIRDTMIGHSVMWSDLPKGLEFLGSIYCGAQEHWKDLVKWENIKEES